MRYVFRILAGVVALLALFSVVAADDKSVQLIGGDENSLRAIVSRLAGQPVADVVGGDEASLRAMALALAGGGPGWNDQPVTVYVAALSKDMPVDLPIPEKANLVGTIDRGQFGITVMFDAPLTPQDVSDFYTSSLSGDGWKDVGAGYASPGFVNQSSTNQTFCYTSADNVLTGLFINVQATKDNTSGTDISINSPADPSMCQGIGEGSQSMADIYSLLPQLKTPDGVEILPQYGGGGGGGGGAAGYLQTSLSATLKSDLAIGDILVAYSDELKAAGWESVSAENTDHLAYSGWNLKDKQGAPWAGSFTLTANPGLPNQYTAILTVQEIPPQK